MLVEIQKAASLSFLYWRGGGWICLDQARLGATDSDWSGGVMENWSAETPDWVDWWIHRLY
jgi:hypothetical protein